MDIKPMEVISVYGTRYESQLEINENTTIDMIPVSEEGIIIKKIDLILPQPSTYEASSIDFETPLKKLRNSQHVKGT